jgi:hypothetical protein
LSRAFARDAVAIGKNRRRVSSGKIGRQQIQWHARCGERVKSRDFARLVERHKTSGYPAFDILKRQFP